MHLIQLKATNLASTLLQPVLKMLREYRNVCFGFIAYSEEFCTLITSSWGICRKVVVQLQSHHSLPVF